MSAQKSRGRRRWHRPHRAAPRAWHVCVTCGCWRRWRCVAALQRRAELGRWMGGGSPSPSLQSAASPWRRTATMHTGVARACCGWRPACAPRSRVSSGTSPQWVCGRVGGWASTMPMLATPASRRQPFQAHVPDWGPGEGGRRAGPGAGSAHCTNITALFMRARLSPAPSAGPGRPAVVGPRAGSRGFGAPPWRHASVGAVWLRCEWQHCDGKHRASKSFP